jgi:hypothetical protein
MTLPSGAVFPHPGASRPLESIARVIQIRFAFDGTRAALFRGAGWGEKTHYTGLMDEALRLAAQELITAAALPPVTAKDLLSCEFWQRLNPDLRVCSGDAPALEGETLQPDEVEAVADSLRRKGYFQTRPTLSVDALGRLRAGIERLRELRLHPSFCFVYDEFWEVACTPSVAAVVGSVLGPGHLQIPRVWCHYVHPVRSASGWVPHVDHDRSGRMTVWIPLTEATLDNGCMYVVARDLAPPGSGFEGRDAQGLLRATRALPAAPGELLGWDFETIHWGSVASEDAASPRISLSLEFIGADAANGHEGPLVDTGHAIPSFEERLLFVTDGILRYSKYEPSLHLFAEMAADIRAAVEPLASRRR